MRNNSTNVIKKGDYFMDLAFDKLVMQQALQSFNARLSELKSASRIKDKDYTTYAYLRFVETMTKDLFVPLLNMIEGLVPSGADKHLDYIVNILKSSVHNIDGILGDFDRASTEIIVDCMSLVEKEFERISFALEDVGTFIVRIAKNFSLLLEHTQQESEVEIPQKIFDNLDIATILLQQPLLTTLKQSDIVLNLLDEDDPFKKTAEEFFILINDIFLQLANNGTLFAEDVVKKKEHSFSETVLTVISVVVTCVTLYYASTGATSENQEKMIQIQMEQNKDVKDILKSIQEMNKK